MRPARIISATATLAFAWVLALGTSHALADEAATSPAFAVETSAHSPAFAVTTSTHTQRPAFAVDTTKHGQSPAFAVDAPSPADQHDAIDLDDDTDDDFDADCVEPSRTVTRNVPLKRTLIHHSYAATRDFWIAFAPRGPPAPTNTAG